MPRRIDDDPEGGEGLAAAGCREIALEGGRSLVENLHGPPRGDVPLHGASGTEAVARPLAALSVMAQVL